MRLIFILLFNCALLCSCPFSSGLKTFKRKNEIFFSPDARTTKSIIQTSLSVYPLSLIRLKEQLGEQYTAYLKQSYEFRENDPEAYQLVQALQELKNPEKKENYQSFIFHLRNCLASQNPNVVSLAEELSYQHFMIDLNSTCVGREYYNHVVSIDRDFDLFNLRHYRKSIQKLFSKAGTLFSLKKGYIKIHKYLYAKGDSARYSVRSLLGVLPIQDKEIRVLRMSCPVIGRVHHQKMDPLFLGYLETLKRRGEVHLYINLQDTLRNKIEKEASEELASLQAQYPNHFFFISFPYNNEFYKQVNLGNESAKDFIGAFSTALKSKNQGFIFPNAIYQTMDKFQSMDNVLHEIHVHYFGEKDYLAGEERRQFIDLAYAKITSLCIEWVQPNVVNWTCQHGVDRAMSALALFDGLLQTQQGQGLDFSKTLYISSWPAFLYHARSPDLMRLERMMSALVRSKERPYSLMPTIKPLELAKDSE